MKNEPFYQQAELALAFSLEISEGFYGTNSQADTLLGSYVDYEKIYLQLSKTQQQTLTNIDELLDIAQAKAAENMRRVLDNIEEESRSKTGILFSQEKGILLPPGERSITPGNTNIGVEPPKTTDRFTRLIVHLQELNIRVDDLIITEGEVLDTQMRQLPYRLVEIPKLGLEILVCNQVGEATFFSNKLRGFDFYAQHSKEEIEIDPNIVRVVDTVNDRWWNEIKNLISQKSTEKIINIRDYYNLRAELKSLYSPEEWVKFNQKQRNSVSTKSLKITKIARVMGVDGSPYASRLVFLEIGLTVFGEVKCLRDAVSAYDCNLVKSEFQNKYSPEEWVKMGNLKRSRIKIFGLGICSVAKILDVEMYSAYDKKGQIKLGEKVFGKIKVLGNEKNTTDVNWMRAEILKKHTAEDWLNLGVYKRDKFKIHGKGIVFIGTIFGMYGKSIPSDEKQQIKLGIKIFGRAQCLVDALSMFDPKNVRSEFQAKYTPESWTKMTTTERNTVTIKNTSITKMARVLGMKCDLIWQTENQIKFGELVFGMDLQSVYLESIKLGISSETTPRNWVDMTSVERRGYKYDNQGLEKLGTLFKVKGNPNKCYKSFLELGSQIYGEDAFVFDEQILAEIAERKARETNE
jgi:hypothetical protein